MKADKQPGSGDREEAVTKSVVGGGKKVFSKGAAWEG